MHVEYYICGLLGKLHRWAAFQEAPEVFPVLTRKNHSLVKDRWGNTEGGLRTPYVDVPIASYIACNPDDPEGICGKMEYFTSEQFLSMGQRNDIWNCSVRILIDRSVNTGYLGQMGLK